MSIKTVTNLKKIKIKIRNPLVEFKVVRRKDDDFIIISNFKDAQIQIFHCGIKEVDICSYQHQ